ncbi:MAG: 5'/3'-nucleotidase SurE [Planctomycetota bacterium]
MRVLLTNDDGIDAPGLGALYAALVAAGRFARIDVAAPSKVQSATSHAVTFHRPIDAAAQPLHALAGHGVEGFAVGGRPADCVKLALCGALEGEPVAYDLVISGMNAGANVGINVLYSGTVGAAREATFEGLPAIAVSLHLNDWEHDHWPRAAAHAADAIARVLDDAPGHGLGPGSLVNINVPVLDGGAEPRGLRLCPIAKTPMVAGYNVQTHPDGTRSFTAKHGMDFGDFEAGTDVDLLFRRFVTLSPMHFDLTCDDTLAAWAGFGRALESEEAARA